MGALSSTLKDAVRKLAYRTSVDQLKRRGFDKVSVMGMDRIAFLIQEAVDRTPASHSLRSGDCVGEHRVIFGSLGDSVEIVHRASSRDIFAKGSIEAARWVAGREPGLYTMLDVLNG